MGHHRVGQEQCRCDFEDRLPELVNVACRTEPSPGSASMGRPRSIRVVVAAIVLLYCRAARADPKDGWSFDIIPYVWTMGLVGDVTIRSTDVHIDKSFW